MERKKKLITNFHYNSKNLKLFTKQMIVSSAKNFHLLFSIKDVNISTYAIVAINYYKQEKHVSIAKQPQLNYLKSNKIFSKNS
jgi:hypothetical protein